VFGDAARATVTTLGGTDPVAFSVEPVGTWAQFGVGVWAQLAQNVSLFASGDYNVHLRRGEGEGDSVGGRLGFRVTW